MGCFTHATAVQEKLNGTIIGTPGSYQNIGNTIAKVFDGNGATFFDGPMANGDWVGLDLGASNQAPVSQVRFTCRSGNGARMVGGQFQTSSNPTFTTGVTTLGTIATAPVSGVSTVMSFTGAAVNRYVRYLAPNNGYGNIAELEFDTSITRSEMTYDGQSRRVKILEKNSSGTVVITKQHLWVGNTIAEERDGSNNVVKRFFGQGVQLNGTNSFYTRDHLGSIRELIDANGNIVSRYDYDPYGRVTKLQGTTVTDADFQYAGYYEHPTSCLNLTKYRAYDPNMGRFLSRDPVAEAGGINLFSYCKSDPINHTDISGLCSDCDALAAEAGDARAASSALYQTALSLYQDYKNQLTVVDGAQTTFLAAAATFELFQVAFIFSLAGGPVAIALAAAGLAAALAAVAGAQESLKGAVDQLSSIIQRHKEAVDRYRIANENAINPEQQYELCEASGDVG